MDTGRGEFITAENKEALKKKLIDEEPELLSKTQKNLGVFYEGEEIELKGSRFKIQAIKPKRLILKLLPKNK
jgi:competence protein ComGF